MISRSGAKKILEGVVGKEDKKDILRYTANFEGLIDLVLNDNEVKFLTYDKEVLDQVEIDDTTYKAPPKRGLPPNLRIARADKVLAYAQKHEVSDVSDVSGVCRVCTQLYND